MEWYHYFSGFWAGAFFVNFVPHFITGDTFRTPFASPPGKGLSSPTVNTVWALINLVIGYLLYNAAKISSQDTLSLILFFIGVTCMSLWLSRPRIHKEI